MSVSYVPVQASAVLTEYKSRVQSLEVQIAASRSRKISALATGLACVAAFVAALIMGLKGLGLLFAPLPILLIVAILQFRSFLQHGAKLIDLSRRSIFYERGIDRIEDHWHGIGNAGLEYARDHHLYQSDLDILGEGSLFELVATTRSEVGAERLASFLLDPVAVKEAQARQDAVKELRGAASLREEVATLGKYQFQNCYSEHLREWLNRSVIKAPRIVPIVLLFSGTTCLLLGLCGYAKIFLWLQIAPVVLPLLLVQAGISLTLMRRVKVHIKTLLALGGDIVVLRQGVELVERQQFRSAKLRGLVERLRSGKAATNIRKLERLLIAVERREDVVVYAFSLWLAIGTQLVLAIERWRARHQIGLEDWLDAWAEFEALNALACFSWEHSDYVFPELSEGGAHFEAEGLCHRHQAGPRLVRTRPMRVSPGGALHDRRGTPKVK